MARLNSSLFFIPRMRSGLPVNIQEYFMNVFYIYPYPKTN